MTDMETQSGAPDDFDEVLTAGLGTLSVHAAREGSPRSRTLLRTAEDTGHEMEGMRAVSDGGRPWVDVLRGPHPPQVARAAGALLTITETTTHAYMIAYQLYDAGLLAEERVNHR